MAPRLIAVDPSLSAPDARAARARQLVILNPGASGPAFSAACPFLKTTVAEGDVAVEQADWHGYTLRAAVFSGDCDEVAYQEFEPSISVTARLHEGLMIAGLQFDRAYAYPEFVVEVDAAASRMPAASRVVRRADLVETEATPPAILAPPVAAVAAAAVAAVAAANAGAAVAAPVAMAAAVPLGAPMAVTSAPIAAAITYGDIYGDTRDGRLVACVALNTGVRTLAAHRVEGSDYQRAWRLAIGAIPAGALGNGPEDDAIVVGRALQTAQYPTMYMRCSARMSVRRADFAEAVRRRGETDAAFQRDRLGDALGSGQVKMLQRLLEGESAAVTLLEFVAAAGLALGVADTSGGPASLRVIDAALQDHRACIEGGADPAGRILAIKDKLERRTLADKVAPERDCEGVLQSHSKVHSEALHRLYDTANFRGQEAAIGRMDDHFGYLYLALTATFLSSAIGSTNGPIDKAEATAAEAWEPIAVFHQLAWGKVKMLLGRPELGKIYQARIHLPVLAGKLAAHGIPGVDSDGQQRLSGLALDALVETLARPSWRGLNLYDDLDSPIMAAFHDVLDGDAPMLGLAAAHRDLYQLLRVRAPLARVMRLVNVTALSGTGSVRAWLAPLEGLVMLHGPGCDAAQMASIGAAIKKYVSDSLEEYVVRYEQARGVADGAATLANVVLDGGNALVQFNQTLRALNGRASRKRGADGDEKRPTLCIPYIVHVDPSIAPPRTASRGSPGPGSMVSFAPTANGGRSSPAPSFVSLTTGLSGVSGRAGASPKKVGKIVTCGKHNFDFDAAKADLEAKGMGDLCVHAMLCCKAPDHARAKLIEVSCPDYGTKGHGTATAHKHVLPAGKDFRPFDFKVA